MTSASGASALIVMEYLSGGSLEQKLRAEERSRPGRRSSGSSSANALDTAHREGVSTAT